MVSVPVHCLKSSGNSQGHILPWPEQGHGESGCPRLCGIASGNQVPQAVALVTVGLVAGTVLAAVVSCGERSANLQEVNRRHAVSVSD